MASVQERFVVGAKQYGIGMAFDDKASRWTDRIGALSVIAGGISTTWESTGSVSLGRTFFSGLRGTVMGDVVDCARTDPPPNDSVLADVVSPVIDAVQAFFDAGSKSQSAEVAPLIARIARTAKIATSQLEALESGQATVADVVGEFERDFQISLLAALTGHTGVLNKLAEWESARRKSGGIGADYLQIASMKFVNEPGPGCLSMHVLNSATDSGINFMTPTTRAIIDRSPALQRNLFGQWFTYIYSTWEDVYRERLATAHGADTEGQPWTKNDISSEFFGEVKQIRHDFAHNVGICSNSASNKILNWATEGAPIHGRPEQMMGLLELFPRAELLRSPTRNAQKSTPLPWGLPEELVTRVRRRLEKAPRKQRAEILAGVIEEWLNTAEQSSDTTNAR